MVITNPHPVTCSVPYKEMCWLRRFTVDDVKLYPHSQAPLLHMVVANVIIDRK